MMREVCRTGCGSPNPLRTGWKAADAMVLVLSIIPVYQATRITHGKGAAR